MQTGFDSRIRLLAGVGLAAGLLAAGAAPAFGAGLPDNSAAMQAELRELFEARGSRAPGLPGNRALEEAVARRFAASGFKHGTLAFDAPVFAPGATRLRLPDGAEHALLPMHPTLLRPGNFAETNFEAELVYLGRGHPEDLERVQGIKLAGTLAVMEFDCGDRWLDLLRFGVRGFVFLAAERYAYLDSYGKIYNTEVGVPRFFAPEPAAAALRAAGRAGGATRVAVMAEPSQIRRETLHDYWVLIPGCDPDTSREVVVLTAPLDANSVVPELASGGDTAGNLYLLLNLLEAWRQAPPAASVLLVAVNAHTQNYLGERLLAWHLLCDTSAIGELRDELAKKMRVDNLFAEQYRRLKFQPAALTAQELNAAMEVLWRLTEMTAAESAAEPPDPQAIEVDRLRAAAEQALRQLHEQRRGFLARMSTAPERTREFEQNRRGLEELRALDDAQLRARLSAALPVFADERILEDWRAAMDASTGVRLAVKSRLQDRVKRELNIVKMTIMDLSRTAGKGAAQDQRLADLRKQKQDLTKVLVVFNKIDIGYGNRLRYRQIAAEDNQRKLLAQYTTNLIAEAAANAARYREVLENDVANGVLRDALGAQRVRLVIALDADWSAAGLGFCALNPELREPWWRKLGECTARLGRETAARLAGTVTNGTGAELNQEPTPVPSQEGKLVGSPSQEGPGVVGARRADAPFVDALSGADGLPQEHFFKDWQSPAFVFHAAEGTPALALRAVWTAPGRAFSPANRLADLDPERMYAFQGWWISYFTALLNEPRIGDPALIPSLPIPGNSKLWSTLAQTFEMDEFAGKPTPSLAVPDPLMAVYSLPAGNNRLPFLVDGDVVNCFTAKGDITGLAALYGLWESPLAPSAYQLDPAGVSASAVIDKGQIQASLQMNSTLYRTSSKTLPMFPSREFIIYDRVDPSLIGRQPIGISKIWVKSGKSRADPMKYGVHGANCLSLAGSHNSWGPLGVYLQRRQFGREQDPLIVLTDQRRYAVHSIPKDPEGVGYLTQQEWGSDFFALAARDMDLVNHHRAGTMRGVVNELVVEFMKDGRAALAAMEKAAARSEHGAYRRAVAMAVGHQVKAYAQIRSMNADMLKAIIVYMALMLPFCYFLQKLIFNFTKMEHELAAFVALFVTTYVGFRLIHPAFKIAMSPEAIFIGFVLGAIGCFVTWMLKSRFSAEMDLIFRGAGGLDAKVGVGFVGQTAMLIGVNNMKRRRTRTALTTATVVLVIFTMLAFSSVSQKVRPILIPRLPEAPYTGLFYMWPGVGAMDEQTPRAIANHFGERAQLLVRRFLKPAAVSASGGVRWRLERPDATGQWASITAVLGLSPSEPDFSGPIPLLYGRPFTGNSLDEIIVPATLAEALHVGAADLSRCRLRFLGREMTVVGILDDARFRTLRDLDPDQPLLPQQAGAKRETGDDPAAAAALAGAAMDLSTIMFVPPALAEELGAKPFMVSVRLPDAAATNASDAIWKEADAFLRVTDARFTLGSTQPFKVGEDAKHATAAGVYLVSGNYKTKIGGLARLVIPLLIAGLLLFNTMLGTVYERKSEIAIYNAIGLNPHHIFIFFLAEALVYGVIGAIGGYLIGQVLAIVAQALNLVRGLNVNFSSLMVVWAILFTVGLVLASTLYPAWVATRTAVPSGIRRWAAPKHDGETMEVLLPFIYQPHLAPGVMAYLHEFFSSFAEASLSDMIASPRKLGCAPDAAGHPVYRAEYGVALAPYDLGVTQAVSLRAGFNPELDSYGLHLHIRRESGQDVSWAATNRPLLERLRKLLLRWRNLDPARHEWYVAKGGEIFGVADETKAES